MSAYKHELEICLWRYRRITKSISGPLKKVALKELLKDAKDILQNAPLDEEEKAKLDQLVNQIKDKLQ